MRGGGANELTTSYNKGIGLDVEIIRTFVLVYTVFSTIDHKKNVKDSHVPVLAPLPIRFVGHVSLSQTGRLSVRGVNSMTQHQNLCNVSTPKRTIP
ncbi:putative aquaporin PIP2-4 [Vitis vinifera]|uniref:Putative aquaporin PIP2-4 n=1 Tax=Vitis vinifera TaxID=29760 RepID=A0A438FU14_VITVI|nr:putative aquaporin PIP2-4 [Vitis vinifera]